MRCGCTVYEVWTRCVWGVDALCMRCQRTVLDALLWDVDTLLWDMLILPLLHVSVTCSRRAVSIVGGHPVHAFPSRPVWTALSQLVELGAEFALCTSPCSVVYKAWYTIGVPLLMSAHASCTYSAFASVKRLGYLQQSLRRSLLCQRVSTLLACSGSRLICAHLGLWSSERLCCFGYCGHFVRSPSPYFCFAFSPSFLQSCYMFAGIILILVFWPFNEWLAHGS